MCPSHHWGAAMTQPLHSSGCFPVPACGWAHNGISVQRCPLSDPTGSWKATHRPDPAKSHFHPTRCLPTQGLPGRLQRRGNSSYWQHTRPSSCYGPDSPASCCHLPTAATCLPRYCQAMSLSTCHTSNSTSQLWHPSEPTQRIVHKEQNCALLESILIFRGQDHENSVVMANKTIVLKALPTSKALFCILIAYRLQTHYDLFKYELSHPTWRKWLWWNLVISNVRMICRITPSVSTWFPVRKKKS